MTVVLEEPDPAAPADSTAAPAPTPGFPYLDLRLVQLVVEHAAEQNVDEPDGSDGVSGGGSGEGSGTSDAALVEQIGLLESLQHSVAAWQATLVRRFARQHVATRLAAGESDPDKLEGVRTTTPTGHTYLAPPG